MDDFKVIIIESMDLKTQADDMLESKILTRIFDMAKINYYSAKVNNLEELGEEFLKIVEDIEGKRIVLHISSHGNENGIQFTDKTFIEWEHFAILLEYLNEVAGGELIVCMSSCLGFSGAISALHVKGKPYKHLIGNTTNVSYADAVIAFAVFYHNLRNGKDVKSSLEIMKTASGNNDFRSATPDLVQYIQKVAIKESALAMMREHAQKIIQKYKESHGE
jgi:hypothetical protein